MLVESVATDVACLRRRTLDRVEDIVVTLVIGHDEEAVHRGARSGVGDLASELNVPMDLREFKRPDGTR